MDESSLKGRVAVVTGGSRGIGRAIAIALAERGASVAISYREREDRRETLSAIRAHGVAGLAHACDISDEASVTAFFDAVRAGLGSPDILINNAGIARDNLVISMQRSQWDALIDTNLSGTFLCVQAVAREMLLRRWGRIVNIASISADVGAIGQAAYSASKAGLLGLTRTLAREFGRQGVLVNAVSPGLIETAITARIGARRARRNSRRLAAAHPDAAENSPRSSRFRVPAAGYITGCHRRTAGYSEHAQH
jgi:3-oxoacyl-[acyl-carrier protein] reductase